MTEVAADKERVTEYYKTYGIMNVHVKVAKYN